MMESGKPIDNLETAQFYIEQLNRLGIDGISITDKKLVQLDKEKKIYEEQIEQFKIKAMLQAHEAEYGSALITQKTLVGDLTKARQDLNNEEQINSEILMDYINKYPTYSEALNACVRDHGSFAKGLSESKTTLDKMNESFVKNQESLNTQSSLLALQSGSAKEQAIANIDLALSYDEVVGASDRMTYKWSDLQSQLVLFGEQMQAHEDGTKKMSETEIEQNKYSRDYIIQCMAEKGVAMSLTYDQMALKLGDTYKNMSQKERDGLKTQYNELVKNGSDKSVELIKQKDNLLKILEAQGIDASSELAKQHMEELETWQKQGKGCGYAYVNKLANTMNESRAQVKQSGVDLNSYAAAGFESKSAELKIDTSGANKDISETQRKAAFNKKASVAIGYLSDYSGISVAGIKLPIFLYESGGLPETGELFVAREAGPELVGRINGKTAVANNDQIVTGISSGVYNAVRSAMQGNGGNGNMNIHATFVMDGEVVGKQVIKYHNGVVKRTGTTPLMI